MAKSKREERFVKILSDGSTFTENRMLYVDRATGVTYLFVKAGYGAGITPLLDADGRPVLTSL